MNFTNEQLTKAKATKSVEELLTLAKENGMELTEEEAKKYFEQWHKECELADEELGNVAGGCGGGDPHAEHLAFSPTKKTSGSDCLVCGGELDFVKLVTSKSGYSRYSVYYCPKGGVYFDREDQNHGYNWGLDAFLND